MQLLLHARCRGVGVAGGVDEGQQLGATAEQMLSHELVVALATLLDDVGAGSGLPILEEGAHVEEPVGSLVAHEPRAGIGLIVEHLQHVALQVHSLLHLVHFQLTLGLNVAANHGLGRFGGINSNFEVAAWDGPVVVGA